MTDLRDAADSMLRALVGDEGATQDAAIIVSQWRRAAHALQHPATAEGALFGGEPADHPAALLRLAPESAR